jgi:hypothetical protein
MSQLVYLASPYSHDDPAIREQRFHAACAKAAELMRAGVLLFSPIAHTHPIAQFDLPKGWDFWERYDREYLDVCKALVVLTIDGWATSKGVCAEVCIMRDSGKPVFWLAPNEMVGDIAQILRGV